MEATLRLVANRTAFIIAHRHTTLRHCDLLLVLDEGRLVKETTSPQSVLREFVLDSKGEWSYANSHLLRTGLRSSVRVIVAGWFSFRGMGATVGDLLARDVAVSWLAGAEIPYDVSTVAPFGDGVDWRTADPAAYTHVVFVCGPFGNGPPVAEFLHRFRKCRLSG